MTGTGVAVAPERRTTAVVALVRDDRVVQAALAMIAVQLVFRAWATYGAWYHYDDFNFISRMMNEGLSPSVATRQYSGHVMPAGMYLSALTNSLAPFDFRLTASVLLGMQALADLLLLWLLVRLFGSRPGILAALSVYLFSVITVPVAIWWAAGVNQLPMQIALFGALASHVSYLRSNRLRHALGTCVWLVLGLAFYEKTLLVFGAIAIISLNYFCSGRLGQRLRGLWREYATGICLLVALGAIYLSLYTSYALTFSPRRAGDHALGGVVSNMVFEAYLPGVMGGVQSWWKLNQWALPTPGTIVSILCLLLFLLLVRELRRCRSRSLRALWLPGFFLGSDIVLVVAARASFTGPLISLDYRFQGEMAAVSAIALACATLPMLGARQQVERTGPSTLLDDPQRVLVVSGIVAALGVASSTQYARHWQQNTPGKPYFDQLEATLSRSPVRLPLVDSAVPSRIMWGLAYPENSLSHMLREFADRVEFPEVATDQLFAVDHLGRVAPAVVPVTRHARRGPHPPCGYRISSTPMRIPLNGPVAYGGWWVRIGYLASAASPVRVSAGGASYSTSLSPGVHALYFQGGGHFDSVRISGLADEVSLCTNDVTVGRPVPRTEFHP